MSVNKRHLLLYNHRISLEKIDTLGIYGKVMIKTIKFGYNVSYMGSWLVQFLFSVLLNYRVGFRVKRR